MSSFAFSPVTPGRFSVSGPSDFDVRSYGATLDAVTDDALAIQAAITAAVAAGGTVTMPPGKTAVVGTTLTISGACRLDFNGSTIKKKSTLNGPALTVSGAGVTLRNLNVDGNQSGGALGNGISVTGTCTAYDVASINSAGHGFAVTGTGTLTAYDCSAINNGPGVRADSWDDAGYGFYVGQATNLVIVGTSVLKAYNCTASNNDNAGFFIDGADGSHVDGYAANNGRYGLWVYRANNGSVGRYHGYDNGSWDCLFNCESWTAFTPHDWLVDTVICENNATTDPLLFGVGAGLVLDATTRIKVGTLIVKGGAGWACVIDGGAKENNIGTIIADNRPLVDTEPCLTFQNSATHNSVGTLICNNYSLAVTFSEEYPTFNNDFNTIGEIHGYGLTHGVVSFSGGAHNRIGRIKAVDCGTTSLAFQQGLVQFWRQPGVGVAAVANDVQGNVVEWLEHRSTKTTSALADTPACLVYCDANVSRNYVLDGIGGGATTDVIDLNGGNFVSLRPLKRVTQIEPMDAGWTSGASNTTAGRFIEGVGGWRLVGTGAFPSIQKTLGSTIDLSAMDNADWFRFAAYVENVSDKHATTPIIVRFADVTGANYFQGEIPPGSLQKNGLQFLYLRKGAMPIVAGAPSWSAIKVVALFVVSAGANTFAVTFDDLVRTERSQFGNGIDATIPFGGKPGDVRVATGKMWVNDAGTWKSVAVA
jgi:hypothetical protein